LSFTLIRSPRRKKTLSIQVDGTGAVSVRVPMRTSRADIDRFLAEKKQWLQKTIDRQRENSQARPIREFAAGERFPFLGETYVLKVVEGANAGDALIFTGREFILKPEALKGARVLFHLWYQRQARNHFEARVRFFGGRLELFPRAVFLSNARSRWGSCSTDGRLAFAWRLILAPQDVVDYVVIHELCHMRVRNHSRDYWRLVENVYPNHRQCKMWLRDHGHLLTL
jgi:hypothetical protein